MSPFPILTLRIFEISIFPTKTQTSCSSTQPYLIPAESLDERGVDEQEVNEDKKRNACQLEFHDTDADMLRLTVQV